MFSEGAGLGSTFYFDLPLFRRDEESMRRHADGLTGTEQLTQSSSLVEYDEKVSVYDRTAIAQNKSVVSQSDRNRRRNSSIEAAEWFTGGGGVDHESSVDDAREEKISPLPEPTVEQNTTSKTKRGELPRSSSLIETSKRLLHMTTSKKRSSYHGTSPIPPSAITSQHEQISRPLELVQKIKKESNRTSMNFDGNNDVAAPKLTQFLCDENSRSYSDRDHALSNNNFMRLSLTAKPDIEVECSSTATSRTSRRDMQVEDCPMRRPRVLLVDDVAVDRKMNVRLLRPHVSELSEAADGLDAVSKVIAASQEGRSIDIIFLDSIMPIMDGPTTVRKLRDMGYTGLVIGVTGQVMRVDIEAFISHGADRVLLKPVNFSQFEEVFRMYYDTLPAGDSYNPLQVQAKVQSECHQTVIDIGETSQRRMQSRMATDNASINMSNFDRSQSLMYSGSPSSKESTQAIATGQYASAMNASNQSPPLKSILKSSSRSIQSSNDNLQMMTTSNSYRYRSNDSLARNDSNNNNNYHLDNDGEGHGNSSMYSNTLENDDIRLDPLTSINSILQYETGSGSQQPSTSNDDDNMSSNRNDSSNYPFVKREKRVSFHPDVVDKPTLLPYPTPTEEDRQDSNMDGSNHNSYDDDRSYEEAKPTSPDRYRYGSSPRLPPKNAPSPRIEKGRRILEMYHYF